MAFDSLSEKLQGIFKNLRGKGRLSEADVKAALKEVKMALLEADVNFRVVQNFVKTVEERAIGQDVLNSLTPGQMVIKIVNEEMVSLLGSETTELTFLPGIRPAFWSRFLKMASMASNSASMKIGSFILLSPFHNHLLYTGNSVPPVDVC